MDVLTATDSHGSAAAKQSGARLNRTAPIPVRGRSYHSRSRRGLLHLLVIDPACPYCGEVHTYRAAGLRIAACRGGYVEITARKARKPSNRAELPQSSGSNCRQATVDSGTVDSVDSSSRTNRSALNSPDASSTFRESRPASVDANSSRGTQVAP